MHTCIHAWTILRLLFNWQNHPHRELAHTHTQRDTHARVFHWTQTPVYWTNFVETSNKIAISVADIRHKLFRWYVLFFINVSTLPPDKLIMMHARSWPEARYSSWNAHHNMISLYVMSTAPLETYITSKEMSSSDHCQTLRTSMTHHSSLKIHFPNQSTTSRMTTVYIN